MNMKKLFSLIFVVMLCLSIFPVTSFANNGVSESGTHKNAKTTAYSLSKYDANGKQRRTHSGKIPAWGMVAMQYGALPFGYKIYTAKPVSHPVYGKRSSFRVEDSGPAVKGTQLDIWFGYCDKCEVGGSINYDAALAYGVKYLTYTYSSP